MRYPNLRYGNPTALRYYAMGRTIKDLAKHLRRDERTVADWLNERAKIPWWVPEILRLQQLESNNIMRQHMQHAGYKHRATLAVVTSIGDLEPAPDVQKPQPSTALRLDDFDPVDRVISCAS